ncbi:MULTISPECIES: helix-turn-helix transcriptional regulator [Actinokineospora]|uniref:Transcriptional regulator n=1 Tax=Actinokineospora fastidiosa TaxID=1816 RepID=A0A918GGH2_9PSEU|nr:MULTISPECIES: LuxR family transcriptional regulator [Actinokineospora]UVS80348.1 transcriptional regulator NarL [Actinokineospora sp. UTMC 2448]GGS34655.1 transcriptional regulator [Actinokineospora fastidiosa]
MDAMLEPVGMGRAESALYVALIDTPHLTLPELAARTHHSTAQVRRPLARLLDSGLVTRLAGTPARYVPAPPEVAIDALVVRRRQELENLRVAARDLGRRLDAAPSGRAAELIELVEGEEAVRQQLARIQLSAEQEVCIVDCPPYMTGRPMDNPPEWQALARGVVYRSIYHTPAIADHGRIAEIRRYMAAGEQARALPDIHMKMTIVDSRIALIPLSFDAAETGVRIIVHQSPLLSALVACFDMLWERATPLGPDAGRTPMTEPSETDRQILTMLAAGMKDKAIARALDIAERTVTRRLTELMNTLDATTRFQAALQASRRGWL